MHNLLVLWTVGLLPKIHNCAKESCKISNHVNFNTIIIFPSGRGYTQSVHQTEIFVINVYKTHISKNAISLGTLILCLIINRFLLRSTLMCAVCKCMLVCVLTVKLVTQVNKNKTLFIQRDRRTRRVEKTNEPLNRPNEQMDSYTMTKWRAGELDRWTGDWWKSYVCYCVYGLSHIHTPSHMQNVLCVRVLRFTYTFTSNLLLLKCE